MGDTVNLASRLQALAEPGSAVLSEATYRPSWRGWSRRASLASITSKANPESQKAYRARRDPRGSDALRPKLHHGLTTFVGRDPELEKLERGSDAIRSGVQVFDIVGEPGIGKSRLVHEFLGQIVKERAWVLVGSCTPDGQQTPFQAFIEIVRGYFFRLGPRDSETVVARKLDEGLWLSRPALPGKSRPVTQYARPQGARGRFGEGLDGVLIGLHARANCCKRSCRLRAVG